MGRAMLLGVFVMISACKGSRSTPESGPSCAIAEDRIQRLLRVEYQNTIRDLLGLPSSAEHLPGDVLEGGFLVGPAVTSVDLELFMRAAEALAANALERWDAVPCEHVSDDRRACTREFIAGFAERAYRRPVGEAELELLLSVYAAGAAANHVAGIELVLLHVLQSPYFLYRVELGTASSALSEHEPTATWQLSGHERASRLSYLLWNTMPDEELFAAADSGALDTSEGVREQAERMLDDPRAQQTIADFFVQWLELDPAGGPALSPASQLHETTRFIANLIAAEGSITDLLLDRTSFVDSALADFYGVAGPEAPDEFTRVELPARERSGILTHASWLSSHPTPIARGKLVRERLLCGTLGNPPDGIPPLPPPSGGTTRRERLERHVSDPSCSSCHELMDPLGFAFEHFDEFGRFRNRDSGRPIDASGHIRGTKHTDGGFDGAIELAELLADSEEVHRCLAMQWFSYALGRGTAANDHCAIEQLQQQLTESDLQLRALLLAVTTTDAFLFRRVSEATR